MKWFNHSSARRREVRRNIQRPAPKLFLWLRRPDIGWAACFVAMLTLLGGALVISGRNHPAYYAGRFVDETILARVAFKAEDTLQTKENREEARKQEPPVFIANAKYFEQVRDRLQALIQLATDPSVKSIDQVPQETQENLAITAAGLEQLQEYYVTEGQPSAQWVEQVEKFIGALGEIAIITPEDEQGAGTKIVIQRPDGGEVARYENALFITNADRELLRDRIEQLALGFQPSNQIRESIIIAALPQNGSPLQPNYLLDPDQTRTRKQAKYEDAANIAEMRYQANDVIVEAGKKLTLQDIEVLRNERRAYYDTVGTFGRWMSALGMMVAVLLIAVGIWAYMAAYYPRILQNPMRGLAITGLILFCQVLAVGTLHLYPPVILPAVTFATLLAAVIIAIAYDRRFALSVGSFNALLVIVSLDLSVGLAIVLLTGIVVAIYQLNDVRNRSKLILTGVWTGLTMGVTALAIGLAERPLILNGEFMRIVMDSLLVMGAAVVTGSVVQNIYPLVEKIFKVTTGMTLKELSDSSLPLLRRLAQDAPGTYQHSLRLADMTEAAAASIGADALLCRVGAMYHDIGKINKPEYFVENQRGGPNRHTKLSPAMSLLIIIGHVKDGIEMAREYGLPRPIRHFIESHHGTTLVEYFYHAAKQQSESSETEPAEFEFRYPGPKPQTKEAAILMLCDSAESATRAQTEPTPARIEQVVHALASKRLMDGQFDECNLTLEELHKIEQSAIKTLCAVYHGRIAYPSEKKAAEERHQPQPEEQETASASVGS